MSSRTRQTDIGSLTAQVYSILKDVEADDRLRVVNAAMALFGRAASVQATTATGALTTAGANGGVSTGSHTVTPTSAKEFVDGKQPETKGETLAVAARYLEQFEDKNTYTKPDLKRVTTAARRNFDDRKFSFDIANARNAGLFSKGARGDGYSLSYYGQQYVDAMPDRESIKKLRRPRTKPRGKKSATKPSAK